MFHGKQWLQDFETLPQKKQAKRYFGVLKRGGLKVWVGSLALGGLLYGICPLAPASANCPDGGARSPDAEGIAQVEKAFAELRQQKTFPWGTAQPYGEVIGDAVILTPAFDSLNVTQKQQVLESLPISAGFLVFSSDWRLLWSFYDHCTGAIKLLTQYDRHQLSYLGRRVPNIVRYPLTDHQQKIVAFRFWSRIGYQNEGQYWISWVPGGGYFEVMVPATQRARLVPFWKVAPKGYRYRVIDQVGNLLAEQSIVLPRDGSKPLLRAAGPLQAPTLKLGQLRQWSTQLKQGQQRAVGAQIRQNRELAQAVFAELLFDTAVSHTTQQPGIISNQTQLLQVLVQTLADPAVSAAYRHWQDYLQGHAVYTPESQGFDRSLFLYLQTVVYEQALNSLGYPGQALAASEGMIVSGTQAVEQSLPLAKSLDLDRATGTGLYHRAIFARMAGQLQAQISAWEAYLKWTEISASGSAQVDALYQLGQSHLQAQNLVLADRYYAQGLRKAESIQDKELVARYHQEFAQQVDDHLLKASMAELGALLQSEAIRQQVLSFIRIKARPSDRSLIPLLVPLLDESPFQEYAARALVNILSPQDQDLRPRLVALLDAPDSGGFYVIRALTQLQDKTVLPLVLPYLNQFPAAVIQAIGALGDASMLPLLEPFLSSSDGNVRFEARRAIETLRRKQAETPALLD